MKVKLYIDLPDSCHYTKTEWISATSAPCKKMDGYTRYRVVVDLPDKHFNPDSEVDFDADIEEGAKVV